MQSSVKLIPIGRKGQLESILAGNLAVVEEGMRLLEQGLPSSFGPLGLLAIDRNGTLTLIEVIEDAEECAMDRHLRHYDYVRSNKQLFERLFKNIDPKVLPRLILIASRFSDSYLNLAMYSTLNLDGLLELKEYALIEIPGGEQTIITRPLYLQQIDSAHEGRKKETQAEQLPTNVEVNGDLKNFAIVGKNTAMIAHDLKNPIQVLMNVSYNVRQEYEGSDGQTRSLLQKSGVGALLNTIDKQMEYMNKLISDMQSLTTEIKLKISEGSLAELFKDITSNIPSTIKINFEIGVDRTNFDYFLMKRAVTNLVMNSVQAMPDGGALSIRTYTEGLMIVIQVKDTGVGIPKEIMENLFASYATTKMNGAGMGLISAKKIIDAHKGTITVDSEVGKGTTFTIKIPQLGQI